MRRVLGALRLTAGLGLAFTIAYQIGDLALGGGIVPDHYFLFFTIDSTLLEIVVLVVAGVTALRGPVDGRALTVAGMVIVPCAIVTALVYNLLLRGLPSDAYQGQDWHNEVVHVAGPIYLVLDWFVLRLLERGRARLPLGAFAWALVFPAAWLAVTMVRGASDGYYPYPFLDVDGPAGVPGVVEYSVGLAVAFAVLGLAGTAVTRVRSP
jgi:hypothetical protein